MRLARSLFAPSFRIPPVRRLIPARSLGGERHHLASPAHANRRITDSRKESSESLTCFAIMLNAASAIKDTDLNQPDLLAAFPSIVRAARERVPSSHFCLTASKLLAPLDAD